MPLGIIAGNGSFPLLALRAARQMGHDVVVVAIEGEASRDLDPLAADLGRTDVTWITLGELGRCIKVLTGAGVTEAVMAGQVKHVKLFGGVMPDLTLLSVLTRLKARNTDALIAAIADVLAGHGITLIDSTTLLSPLLAGAGVLGRVRPSDDMTGDFVCGYGVADTVAGVDEIGRAHV